MQIPNEMGSNFPFIQLFLDAESYAGHHNTTELLELLAECNKNVVSTIQLLNKIKSDTQATSSSAQDTTMRDELVTQLQAKFLDATNALLNAQTKYKFDIENVVKAEVHRLNNDATDDEIDAALVVTNKTNNADYTIRSGRAALVRPTLYGTSTPDLVKGTVLSYPDLPVLTGSLSELQQSFYYYVLLPTSSTGTLSNSIQPLQAIGTRPVSDNEASEMHLLQNGHFSIMRQRRNRALFGFFLIGGLIAYLFLSRRLSIP
jgi:hypothetical protein